MPEMGIIGASQGNPSIAARRQADNESNVPTQFDAEVKVPQ